MENGLIGWLFIIVALIFIFGGKKRLEDLGGGFGGFMREFKKARDTSAEEAQKDAGPAPKKKPAKKKAVKTKKKK
jgi:Sec-independent protein translocase protein TatA